MAGFLRLIVALTLWFAGIACAEVPVPPLTARVTDLTATLSGSQKQTLEAELQTFENKYGAQLAVLLVPSTQPETIEQYSMRVVEAWRLGQKGKDNGVLILVAKNDRKLRIEVGYGLEGDLPDATARRIIDETISPYFKQGDFAGGLTAGVHRVMATIAHDAAAEKELSRSSHAKNGRSGGDSFHYLVFGALIGGAILRTIFGRFLGSLLLGGGVGVVAWLMLGSLLFGLFFGVIAFIVALQMFSGMSSRHHGGWGGGYSGGGGFSGGGFSGGGGSFGGGGASGGW